MTAWLDRPAERERDLQDISHVLELYLPQLDERRWTQLADLGLQFDEQSAYALGYDLGERLQPYHLQTIESFLGYFGADSPHLGTMRRLAPTSARLQPEALERRLSTFRRGLYAGQRDRA